VRKASLLVILLLVAGNSSANASLMVQYKSQKAGQFCKNIDIGKFVVTPGSGKLKCVIKSGSNRAKWIHS